MNSELKKQKELFEIEVSNSISEFGEKTILRDACEYALTSGGKRFRPLLTLTVADALGNGLNVMPAALSVEFFHTASLIADDLPCMDNDSERRDKPSLHAQFGETTALLASYALITAGFEYIHKNYLCMKSRSDFADRAETACVYALESAARCSGIRGATGGQFLDMFPKGSDLASVQEVLYKKTVTLFEVSFLFGWVFGGGDCSASDTIKQAAYRFGMAFQIADDLNDLAGDEDKSKIMNMAKLLGKEKALDLFETEIKASEEALRGVSLYTPSFRFLIEKLRSSAYRSVTR